MSTENKSEIAYLATPGAVLEELKTLYWTAVHKEVQNMIEFHCVLKTVHGVPQSPASLECDNFKKMFDIWGTYTPPYLTSTTQPRSANSGSTWVCSWKSAKLRKRIIFRPLPRHFAESPR